jgi:hypothetical protein
MTINAQPSEMIIMSYMFFSVHTFPVGYHSFLLILASLTEKKHANSWPFGKLSLKMDGNPQKDKK